MVLTAARPYFAPYAGFFWMALNADVLVLLDGVQFPQGRSWITRNRFKNHRGELRLTIPVRRRGLGRQRIDAVGIQHEGAWARKHLTSLREAYRHAPYLSDHLGLLEEIFSPGFFRIADLNTAVIAYILARLDAPVQLVRQSELGIEGKGIDLISGICTRLGARRFLTLPGARAHLEAGHFARLGIELAGLSPPAPVYPQLWGPFIPNLSSLDLLLNCGPKAREIILKAG